MRSKIIIPVLFVFLMVVLPSKAQAQMDPRVKAVGTMALYGTVGGLLLGTASLAFGTDGRSVAQGASLGLYAGLLFGGYVVSSHYLQRQREQNPVPQDNYYPDSESPYEGDEDQRWNPYLELSWESLGRMDLGKETFRKREIPLFYIDLVQFNF